MQKEAENLVSLLEEEQLHSFGRIEVDYLWVGWLYFVAEAEGETTMEVAMLV